MREKSDMVSDYSHEFFDAYRVLKLLGQSVALICVSSLNEKSLVKCERYNLYCANQSPVSSTHMNTSESQLDTSSGNLTAPLLLANLRSTNRAMCKSLRMA
jgi:pyridoxal/pyridoxine/pyridoxamine kinase